jgi:hypothetical protein
VIDKIWEKPVIVLYREDHNQQTRDALAVLRARRLTLIEEEGNDEITGRIEDFFPLMGDISGLQGEPKDVKHYILCVYNDNEKPYDQPDRISGVVFPEGLSFIRDQYGKRTYHGSFQATRA